MRKTTKQSMKKVTQHRVTTGTFLKVAKFMGVSRTTREGEASYSFVRVWRILHCIVAVITFRLRQSNLSRYNVPDSLLSQRYGRKMRLP